SLAKVLVHAFLDGRDVPPKSALPLMKEFEQASLGAAAAGAVRIATVQGRFFAMDRDNRWERVERAWRAIVRGEGAPVGSGLEAVERGYARGETDEFLQPSVVIDPEGKPLGPVRNGDAIVHFNFRADRARELTRALALDDCPHFERPGRPKLSRYVCLTEYDKTFSLPVAFPSVAPRKVFGEVAASLGLRQVRMAETEKYAHVTYFFNGGRELPFEGEERVLVPSERRVATYDLHPEMSAPALTEAALGRIRDGAADFLLLNFANPDMVGHTGIYEAAVRACKVVDESVGRIVAEVLARGGATVVTADHGNCEQMYDPITKSPHTAHTRNPVPCVLASEKLRGRRLRDGGLLSDVAPTLLDLLQVGVPAEMEGTSLLAADSE
ncbi:MAG: 2,3-bisphosphoglycerate-independent phosphoglycerate mutase, partial [Acidobacteria bacterium]